MNEQQLKELEVLFNTRIDDAFDSVFLNVLTPEHRAIIVRAIKEHRDGPECPDPEETIERWFSADVIDERQGTKTPSQEIELNALCMLAANALHRLRRGDLTGAVNSICEVTRFGAIFKMYSVVEASSASSVHSKDSAERANTVIRRYRELEAKQKADGLKALGKTKASEIIDQEHIVHLSQRVIRNILKGVR